MEIHRKLANQEAHKLYALLFCFFLVFASLSAEEPSSPSDAPSLLSSRKKLYESWEKYPQIGSLSQSNELFRQFLREVHENASRWQRSRAMLPTSFYTYRVQEQDSLISISARANISMESIATLNQFEHPQELPKSSFTILLPNSPGVFIPEQQTSEWEKKLALDRQPRMLYHRIIVGERTFHYYPNSQFNQEERSLFLENIFRSPVKVPFYITSPFGNRKDPIRGNNSFHDGIDIRSPYGSEVLSVASGTVTEIGESPVYGLYLRIRLNSQLEVLYGHLVTALVAKGAQVYAGEVLASSGDSGRSTGPHLHFSVFKNSKAVDPKSYFKGTL